MEWISGYEGWESGTGTLSSFQSYYLRFMTTTLITGAAGFIGFHLSQRLLKQGERVIGVDNLNNYYDVTLKQARLQYLYEWSQFHFETLDIASREGMEQLFEVHQPDTVVHLAAQAGVRYSLSNPYAYVDSNIVGFLNVLEGCRHHAVQHLVYASSSSVYGSNRQTPFSVQDRVDRPISLYAATKKSNELMAYSYSHLYQIPMTGLRFFTVYGPWGRPDMAYFLFTRAICNGDPIKVFNHGQMYRDFTYIDDIVEGIRRVIQAVPQARSEGRKSPDAPTAELPAPPYRLYNIGNNQPVSLLSFIETLESLLGKTAEKIFLPLQPGDVLETYADIDDLTRDTGFKPVTPLQIGLAAFVDWFRVFYRM